MNHNSTQVQQENKHHWYDGWFYDTLIAPNQDRMYSVIEQMIPAGSRVIDIGCGTGRFLFQLAGKCSFVAGTDLSETNIRVAISTLDKNKTERIAIHHGDGLKNIPSSWKSFDYAVITYVLHEMHPEDRQTLLQQIHDVARYIIIGEYMVPQPPGFIKLLNTIVERVAGKDHYLNYRNFLQSGGTLPLIESAGFRIVHSIENNPHSSQIVLAATKMPIIA